MCGISTAFWSASLPRPFIVQCLGRLGLVRNINIYTFSDMSIRGGAIPLIRVCAVTLVHEKGTEDPDEEAGDTPHTLCRGNLSHSGGNWLASDNNSTAVTHIVPCQGHPRLEPDAWWPAHYSTIWHLHIPMAPSISAIASLRTSFYDPSRRPSPSPKNFVETSALPRQSHNWVILVPGWIMSRPRCWATD